MSEVDESELQYGLIVSTLLYQPLMFTIIILIQYSLVYTGILIQILIQTGCIYMEANWIRIQTQTTSPMWIVIQIRIRIRGLVLM